MKLRKLLLGEPRGDYDFIHSTQTKPAVRGDVGVGDAQRWQSTDGWFDFVEASNPSNVQSQFRSAATPFPRYLYIPSSGNPSNPYGAWHALQSCGATLQMVFGYKSGENAGTVELRDPVNILMQYILSSDPQVTRYSFQGGYTRYALLVLGKRGGNAAVQSLTHVRVWDEIDLEPYVEQLLPYSVERSLYQAAPFAFTAERTEQKGAMATLLMPRADWSRLQLLLDMPGRLEIAHTIDSDVFLQPISVRAMRVEPVQGTLLRVSLEMQLLQPYAYMDARLSTVATNALWATLDENKGSAPAPASVHLLVNAAYLNIAYTVRVQPADAQMSFTPDEAGRWYFMEDGRLILVRSNGEWVDKTSRLSYDSELLSMYPGGNFVRVLVPSGGPSSIGEIGVHYHPRIGEMQLA